MPAGPVLPVRKRQSNQDEGGSEGEKDRQMLRGCWLLAGAHPTSVMDISMGGFLRRMVALPSSLYLVNTVAMFLSSWRERRRGDWKSCPALPVVTASPYRVLLGFVAERGAQQEKAGLGARLLCSCQLQCSSHGHGRSRRTGHIVHVGGGQTAR